VPFDFVAFASEIPSENMAVPEIRIAAIITNMIVFVIANMKYYIIKNIT
jgi:hypothetical protein